MTADEMLSLLPWRAPFLMIDRLVECTPHEHIVTRKLVTSDDPLAASPGGGESWFPASLLLEGMSQSAALLFRMSRPIDAEGTLPLLGWMAASLHGSARPGDTLRFDVHALKMTANGGLFRGSAQVGDSVVAEAELAFGAGRAEADRGEKGAGGCS